MVSEFAQRREEFDDDDDERRSEAAQEIVKGKKGLEEANLKRGLCYIIKGQA